VEINTTKNKNGGYNLDNFMNEAILQTMASRRTVQETDILENRRRKNTPMNSIGINKSSINHYVGMAFVPMQQWEEMYDSATAFHVGSIFPCLNKPFFGKGK